MSHSKTHAFRLKPGQDLKKEILQYVKEKQIKAIGKWTDEKIKETYIKVNGEYRDCVFVNNWIKK